MHEPTVGNGFFPAARIGVAIGLALGVAGVVADRHSAAPTQTPAMTTTAALPAPAPLVALPVEREIAGPLHSEPIPLRGPVVVHVWLQGCADCMDAFAAFKEIKQRGLLDDLRQVNVAYGRASPEFVREWGVFDRLVFDEDGSAVVRRFNIGSFTTLVLDRNGNELLRARPGKTAGYVDNVRLAYERASR